MRLPCDDKDTTNPGTGGNPSEGGSTGGSDAE